MTLPTTREADFDRITTEVQSEIFRSIAKHGEQNHLPMGTGPITRPLSTRIFYDGMPGLHPSYWADDLADLATLDTKAHSQNEGGDGTVTWWHILREEVFEAAAESDPAALRAELIQVAAVALKMVDAIDRPAEVSA